MHPNENPFISPQDDSPPEDRPQPRGTRSGGALVSTYAIINLAVAAVLVIPIVLLFCTLIYGVFYSGDPPEEMILGVAGVAFLGAPLLAGFAAFAMAGVGLIRRRRWGYYAHIVAAITAIFTCIGVIYTIFALLHAQRPEFQAQLFRSPRHG